jgi:hypothetical protein
MVTFARFAAQLEQAAGRPTQDDGAALVFRLRRELGPEVDRCRGGCVCLSQLCPADVSCCRFNRLVNELRLSLRQPGDFRPTLVELAKLLLSKGGPSLARSMVPFLPEGARDAFRRTVNAAVS